VYVRARVCVRVRMCACARARVCVCVFFLLTWKILWAPNNASKWQMVFNSAFKWLMMLAIAEVIYYW